MANEMDQAKQRLGQMLDQIVPNAGLHARWLNTLSYMEHVGATKIARTQSGQQATYMVLKHAAEEARHAFYLKRLAAKIWDTPLSDYRSEFLLAAQASRQYLYRLDIGVSRAVLRAGVPRSELSKVAYLMVTYAIEVRADALYPVYQEFLDDYPTKLSVNSIINEEVGHLEEMENEIAALPEPWQSIKKAAIELETGLFESWTDALEVDLARLAVKI